MNAVVILVLALFSGGQIVDVETATGPSMADCAKSSKVYTDKAKEVLTKDEELRAYCIDTKTGQIKPTASQQAAQATK